VVAISYSLQSNDYRQTKKERNYMYKNLTRKGVALASGISLMAFGLVAQPAVAAAGDVDLSPTTGTSFTVFNTDDMNLTTSISPFLDSAAADDALSYLISNPDQHDLLIDFNAITDAATVDLTGIKADGSTITVLSANLDIAVDLPSGTTPALGTGTDKTGDLIIDFAAEGIVSLLITDMDTFYAEAQSMTITVIAPTHVSASALLTQTQAIAARAASLGYGGDNASITVQAWLESSSATVVDSAYASDVAAVTFVDPDSVSVISKVERVIGTGLYGSFDVISATNQSAQAFVGGSLRFSNSTINLDQVDLTKWKYQMDSSVAGDDIAMTAIALGDVLASGVVLNVLTPAGYTSTNVSAFGRLLIQAPVAGNSIEEPATYKFVFRHGADSTPFSDYSSAAYQVTQNTQSATAVAIGVKVADTENVAIADYSSGFATTVRNGNAAVKFATTIQTDAGVAVETANVPVLAKVTAGANLPAGATLTVSGTTEKISKKNGALYVTGLTGSDGDWDLTVTSSDTSSAGTTYVVEFFVLEQLSGNTDAWTGTFDGTDLSKYTLDYAAATYTTFTADSSVLSGATATVTLSVKDQFGQALSASSTAKAYSVELLAPVTTNLKQYVAVVDGKATFTFDNYLTEGGSDVLTAKLFTGTSTSPSYVSGASTNISLYNSNAAHAVYVLAKVTGVVVTYDDFITGVATSTNVAPNDNKFTYTGTVVDANGAGVPGAPVVVTGSGFQFAKTGTTTYSIDSITLAASEAGSFSVDVYAHVASLTQKLTVTSGTKTASSVIASAIPVDGNGTDGSTGLLSAANLKFSWDAPATPVMNTTYAVTATVTDKWGNPVKGAAVTFGGFAAALFNGVASTNKVTGSDGTAVAYLRSIKDVAGLAAIGVTLTDVDQDADAKSDTDDLSTVFTDVVGTVWDESTWSAAIDAELTFLESAADLPAAGDTKVNVGSFKGYVALYAKGYKGQKMTAIVAGKWIKVDSLASDFERVVRYTGAGYSITTKIYIDGVQIGDAFTTMTK
jgi:protocatechuate 3,4-dioxygenase beta subunit